MMNTTPPEPSLPEYLASVSEGSIIYLRVARQYVRGKVLRVTSTQITCGHSRYRKSDGQLIGASAYEASRIVVPTPQIIEQTRIRELEYWLENKFPGEFLRFSLEQKEQLYALATSIIKANQAASGSDPV